MTRTTLFVLALAACIAGQDTSAVAKAGGNPNRVRNRVAMTAESFKGRARLTIRRDGVASEELRLQVEGAAKGLDLRVFVEDADGVMTEVATMSNQRRGRYLWRVRTKRGDALPFGQSDLSGLSGRRVEVRTRDGVTAFTAEIPVISVAKAPRFAKKLRTALAVDHEAAAALGSPRLKARAEVGRHRHGRQRFRIHVANAVSGQTFEVWVQDPVTGEMTYLTSITTGEPPAPKFAKDDGPDDDEDADDEDEDGDDHDADDDGVDDEHEDEGEFDVDTDDGDDLPEGVTSVSDLAGLDVELRTEDGVVVAEGEIPAIGDDHRADDDDDDGVEDGTEHDHEDGDDGDGDEDESGDD